MSNHESVIQKDDGESRLNPLTKLFSLVIILTGIIIYPSWKLSLILLIVLLFLFKISQILIKLSRRRTKFIILFSVILLLFQVLITVNGTILGFIIPRINTIGPYFPITDYGLERGLSISLRFLLIIFSSMLFVAVTDPTLLAHSLTKLRIPYRYTFALVIALRFLPLFESENQIVRQAQRSRGIQPEVRGFKKILRTIQYMFFPLLVSSLSRVETLSLSMDGRGFGYHKTRKYLRKSSWKILDTVTLLVVIIFIILCVFLANGIFPQLSTLI